MGKTSSAVKNRYNAKAYDQIPLRVKKGQKEVIQAFAAQKGKSVNSYIIELIEQDMACEDGKAKSENPTDLPNDLDL